MWKILTRGQDARLVVKQIGPFMFTRIVTGQVYLTMALILSGDTGAGETVDRDDTGI